MAIKKIKNSKLSNTLKLLFLGFVFVFGFTFLASASASAQTIPPGCPGGPAGPLVAGTVCPVQVTSTSTTRNACGSGSRLTYTAIDLGCEGDNCVRGVADPYCGSEHNPIVDMAFAIIRFLSAGAGVVIVLSTVWAGVQYTLAHDDPGQVSAAKTRIRNNIIALLVFIFGYAILNFVIPGGFFK